jgi:hypothetical protein
MKTYQVTMNEKQVMLLSYVSECTSRWLAGQPDMMIEMLGNKDGEMAFQDHEDKDAVCNLIKKQMGINDGSSSWNMPKSEDTNLLWDIYQVFRHRISWDKAIEKGIIKEGECRNFSEMFGVSYDEPMRRGSEFLCTIKEIKGDSK